MERSRRFRVSSRLREAKCSGQISAKSSGNYNLSTFKPLACWIPNRFAGAAEMAKELGVTLRTDRNYLHRRAARKIQTMSINPGSGQTPGSSHFWFGASTAGRTAIASDFLTQLKQLFVSQPIQTFVYFKASSVFRHALQLKST
jgi:hypothetical protein